MARTTELPVGTILGGVAGGIAGASTGSPGAAKKGAQMGSQIGGTIQQLWDARENKKSAEAAMPAPIDPQQAAFAAELEQKRKSIDTGSAYASGMDEADQSQTAANDAIVRATGGDVSGTIDALIKAQRASGEQKNQILAQGDAAQRYYTGLYGSTVDKIAQRRIELQLIRRNQALAEWAENKKGGMANLNALIAGAGSQGGVPNLGSGSTTAPAADFNAANPGIQMDTNQMGGAITPDVGSIAGGSEISGLTAAAGAGI